MRLSNLCRWFYPNPLPYVRQKVRDFMVSMVKIHFQINANAQIATSPFEIIILVLIYKKVGKINKELGTGTIEGRNVL